MNKEIYQLWIEGKSMAQICKALKIQYPIEEMRKIPLNRINPEGLEILSHYFGDEIGPGAFCGETKNYK